MPSKGLLGQPTRQRSCWRSQCRLIRAYATWRPLCIIGMMMAWILLRKHNVYVEVLRTKYERTEFLDDDTPEYLIRSQMFLGSKDTHGDRLRLWEERANWRHLGSGHEGDVYAYNNSVIKTFNTKSSPLRNCVPGITPKIRWPTEIQASLLLDGGVISRQGQPVQDSSDFVPVQDFFLSFETDGSPGEWHMVSPLLESGDLKKLARRLRGEGLSYRELDARFRPSFHRLLRALHTMHTKHNLCHDDIKLDNVFVTSFSAGPADTHWLLGDLGNTRQLTHAYHKSRLWRHDNGQTPDCRANDGIRLVKTYTRFLRLAASDVLEGSIRDREPFDAAFFAQREPWSRLYWAATSTYSSTIPKDATALLEESLKLPPGYTGNQAGGYAAPEYSTRVFSQPLRLLLRGAAHQELSRGLSLTERHARIYGVLGVQQSPC